MPEVFAIIQWINMKVCSFVCFSPSLGPLLVYLFAKFSDENGYGASYQVPSFDIFQSCLHGCLMWCVCRSETANFVCARTHKTAGVNTRVGYIATSFGIYFSFISRCWWKTWNSRRFLLTMMTTPICIHWIFLSSWTPPKCRIFDGSLNL